MAHINGYTTVPVATLRELLASRGGVVEAYNTSRCTHMICETLPYAKVKELRKVSLTIGEHLVYEIFLTWSWVRSWWHFLSLYATQIKVCYSYSF